MYQPNRFYRSFIDLGFLNLSILLVFLNNVSSVSRVVFGFYTMFHNRIQENLDLTGLRLLFALVASGLSLPCLRVLSFFFFSF